MKMLTCLGRESCRKAFHSLEQMLSSEKRRWSSRRAPLSPTKRAVAMKDEDLAVQTEHFVRCVHRRNSESIAIDNQIARGRSMPRLAV